METMDTIRAKALNQMDRAQSLVKWAILGAAFFEAVCLIGLLMNMNFRDKLHMVIFFGVGLIYCPLALGLVAVGAHVSRCTLRVLQRLDDLRS